MNRRLFIQKSILGASALALTANEIFANERFSSKKLDKFGCQLYSVRDKMPKDPKGTMEALAKMGYQQFESYSADPFWGMSAPEAKTFLGNIGVDMISSHVGVKDFNEELVAKAAEVGLKYVICPFIGMQPNMDAWKKVAEDFNKNGELCKKYGIQYGYHNHSYSFAFVNGMRGQVLLLENTDPDLVCYELDMCWSEAAGENTIAHLARFGNRYELCHVKQLLETEPKPKQTDLADGIIDYNRLLTAARKGGMKYYIVEQEQYPDDSLESMKKNAEFMKNLNI